MSCDPILELNIRLRATEGREGKSIGPLPLSTSRTSFFEKLLGGSISGLLGPEQVLPQANTKDAFELARTWLRTCCTTHSCAAKEPTLLPTRILDLRGSNRNVIRLRNPPPEERGRYAALSYCWGSGFTSTTTPSNLAERMSGISISQLPQTLQDAVQIARELDIKLLWVDALCILQGESEEARADWLAESACMSSIFGNSHVTISAAAASSCDEGIFSDQWSAVLPIQRSALVTGHIRVSLPLEHRRFKDEPILSRGWTLQESLLSPRVLIYTSRDIWWQCDTGMKSRDYPRGPGNADVHSVYRYRLSGQATMGARTQWSKITELYGGRNLTRADDKFPAVAGIAKHFADCCGDEYVAGLWKESLIRDLMWTRDDMFKAWLALADTPDSRDVYRAPSWSWASCDGIISMLHSRNKSRFDAQVVDYHIDLVDPDNPYGQIKAASLTLHGRIKQIRRLAMDASETPTIYAMLSSEEVELGKAWLDDDDECAIRKAAAAEQVYVFLLTTQDYNYYMLLIPASPGSEQYQRIGIANSGTTMRESWFDDAIETTITII